MSGSLYSRAIDLAKAAQKEGKTEVVIKDAAPEALGSIPGGAFAGAEEQATHDALIKAMKAAPDDRALLTPRKPKKKARKAVAAPTKKKYRRNIARADRISRSIAKAKVKAANRKTPPKKPRR